MTYLNRLATSLTISGMMALTAQAQTPVLANESPIMWTTLCPPELQCESESHGAYRIAEEEERVETLATSGATETLADGHVVWTLGYAAPGATTMSAIFADMEIPEGGWLVVSRPDGLETFEVKPCGGRYTPSETITGDSLVIQYAGPSGASFGIASVCKGIVPMSGLNKQLRRSPGVYGSSTFCEVPAACHSGLEGPRRATCRIIINNSTLGTATLMNNTANDFTPYILTSAHVVGKAKKYSTVKALFGFEEPLCSPDGNHDHGSETIVGGQLICYDETSDLALIKLSATPGVQSGAYWAGWNIKTPEMPVTCFHHPYGDSKKVSVANTVATATYRGGTTPSGQDFRQSFHWYVNKWESGVTESGSSGSSLLDASGLVCGGLTGGSSTCSNPSADYYWQLGQAWEIKSETYATLKETLDPKGTGADQWGGIGMQVEGHELLLHNNFDKDMTTVASKRQLGEFASVSQDYQLPEEDGAISISVVRIWAGDVTCYDTSDDGAKVKMEIVGTDGNVMYAGSKQLSAFASDKAVDFVMSPALRLTADIRQVSIRVSASGLVEDELWTPLCSTADSHSSWSDAAGNRQSGEPVMMGIAYSRDSDSNTLTDKEKRVCVVRVESDGIGVTGACERATAYDRSGHIVGMAESADGERVWMATNGWASGIYILKVDTRQGTERYKVIVTKRNK